MTSLPKVEEEQRALPPTLSPEQIEEIRAGFEEQWNRSIKLRDALSKLPSKLVLESGLSGKRNDLVERWDYLETPGIEDNLPSPKAVHELLQWVHEAEMLIGCIINIGKTKKAEPKEDTRVFLAPDVTPDDYPVVIDKLDDADFVSEKWHWPWETKSIAKAKKKPMSRGDMLKYGAIASVGGLAALALLFDRE